MELSQNTHPSAAFYDRRPRSTGVPPVLEPVLGQEGRPLYIPEPNLHLN
jgi:hypothetical protein